MRVWEGPPYFLSYLRVPPTPRRLEEGPMPCGINGDWSDVTRGWRLDHDLLPESGMKKCRPAQKKDDPYERKKGALTIDRDPWISFTHWKASHPKESCTKRWVGPERAEVLYFDEQRNGGEVGRIRNANGRTQPRYPLRDFLSIKGIQWAPFTEEDSDERFDCSYQCL